MKPAIRHLTLSLILLVTGCALFDKNRQLPKLVYGVRSAETIAVTAKNGFRKPGIHHVPKGTTLRHFLEKAVILPHYRWGHAEFFCGCRVQMQSPDGRSEGFRTPGEPSEQQLDTVLRDRAVVALMKWNL